MIVLFQILFVFFAFYTSALCNFDLFDNFDCYRISANYNGSAYNGTSILVYGDVGMITISMDGGKSWKHVYFDDTLNIISMISIDKTIMALHIKII
jgi:hypothetical protein